MNVGFKSLKSWNLKRQKRVDVLFEDFLDVFEVLI